MQDCREWTWGFGSRARAIPGEGWGATQLTELVAGMQVNDKKKSAAAQAGARARTSAALMAL